MRRYSENGQSAVEMAIMVPILALLLVVAADFARLFYVYIAVNSAARAGAQYGSQSVTTAADVAGMKAAATLDGTNITGMTATASQCTCMASTVVTACPTSYCTANSQATFVEVDTTATFTTDVTHSIQGLLGKVFGIPSSITLTGKAIMQVQS